MEYEGMGYGGMRVWVYEGMGIWCMRVWGMSVW